MAVRKPKGKDIEVQKAKITKPKAKPKFKTKLYPLVQDVEINGEIIKKGTKYPLTDEGAKYFKQKFYIK